jgi:hypothetical protein
VTPEAWTDDRLDDLAAALRPVPAQLARNTEEIERLTDELRDFREEMREDMRGFREDMRAMRADFSAMQRQLAQIGWGMAGVLVTALVALIVALA